MRRHLLFHVFPVADGSGCWQRAVDQLRLRRGLFDGVRACGIVTTGAGSARPLAPPEDVRRYGGDLFTDYFEVPNNDPHSTRSLREVLTWGGLWERCFAAAGPGDRAFWCHAKGVTHPPDAHKHAWASWLYAACLDWPRHVDRVLDRHPVAGCFKKIGAGFGSEGGPWHYHGAFLWGRVADVKERLQRTPMPPIWHGAESWPGVAFQPHEGGVIFYQASQGEMNMYQRGYAERSVRPAWAKWLSERAAEGDR